MASASNPLRRAPAPDLPKVHQIVLPTPWEVGPVQVYLVESEPLTLVDTGVRTPACWHALTAALEALGHGIEDLRRVILTHWHGDHLGQAQSLRDAGAEIEVWTHADEAPWCENFSAERDMDLEGVAALFREYGVPEELLRRQMRLKRTWLQDDPLCGPTSVQRVLRQGDRIAFKDFCFEVLHAPGHTEGHLLLYERESQALLTGDHLMGNAVPFTTNHYVVGPPDPRDPLRRRPRFRGLSHYMASLRDLQGRACKTLLPAHGGVLQHPRRNLEDAILFYEVRIQRVWRALQAISVERGVASAWEIWQRVFPKADPLREMRNRMFLVIGALDIFEEGGRLTVERGDDGSLRFKPRASLLGEA